MPDNLAQRITDELTQRDIDLLRVQAQSERDANDAIDLITAELVSRLIRKDPTAVGRRFGQVRLDTLINESRTVIRDAYRELYSDVRSSLLDLLRDERGVLPDAVGASLGIGSTASDALVTSDVETALLRDIIDNRILTLSATDGETLRGLFEREAAAHARRLGGTLNIGFAQEETLAELVDRLKALTSIQVNEASAILRTAYNHVVNQLRVEIIGRSSVLFRGVIWISILDTSTTFICIGRSRGQWDLRNGKPLPESPVQYSFPGPPPAHAGCRSQLYPLTRSESDIEREALASLTDDQRALLTPDPPADETYTEWLRRQSTAAQDRALGPTRRRLWLAGDLDLRELTTQKGRPLRLDELQRRRNRASAK
jgi:hypothetical protein